MNIPSCPLNWYLYTHALAQLRDLRDVSLLMKLTTEQSTENACLQSTQPHMEPLCHIPFSQNSGTFKEDEEELLEPEARESHSESVSWTQQDHWTQELTAAVVESSQHSNIEGLTRPHP